MHTVQLALADAVYSAVLRDALVRSGPWHVVPAAEPDPMLQCVVVIDEDTFERLQVPLSHPERVVLITRKDPQHLSRAWDAGIVSVVSMDDAPTTVLLAIMAAALRIPKAHAAVANPGGISPTRPITPASIAPEIIHSAPKRCKSHQ
jgi:hypothetical protein